MAEQKSSGAIQGTGVWLFAYGSIMWNPGFAFTESAPALLRGWHRAFCIYSYRYRGTPEKPGLVLGLDRGGSCRGVVFRLPDEQADAIIEQCDTRELVTGVYIRRQVTVQTSAGPVTGWAYVTDRKHQQYAGKLDEAEKVRLIVQGVNPQGATNIEYLENTVRHLADLGIDDPYLRRLWNRVEKLVAG
jgi:cation transport protein ChaC